MKITVLDCHDKKYTNIASLTSPIKERYCQRHGYNFVVYNFGNIGRPPTWGKVLGVKHHLTDSDYILFLDTDVLIMNLDVKIENYIDERYNLQIGYMPDFNTGIKTHISTSAFIIKNTNWSQKFLNKWWNTEAYIDSPYFSKGIATRGTGGIFYEQSAFHFLYETNKDCVSNIKIMPFPWFNTREVNYKSGDFLIHFARQTRKEERIKKFLKIPFL